jgi:hypothetical protein
VLQWILVIQYGNPCFKLLVGNGMQIGMPAIQHASGRRLDLMGRTLSVYSVCISLKKLNNFV